MSSLSGYQDATGSASGQNMSGMAAMGNKIPKGYRSGYMQQFTPEQMQLFQNMFGQVGQGSFLSRLAGGDEGMFQQMEAPAHREFQGQLGQLASRFSGMGLGGRHGSGFQLASTQAASDFSQDLASRRMMLQRQAIQDLMGMSNDLLGQRPYEQFLVPKSKSFLKELGIAGAEGAGTALSMLPFLL